MQFAKPIVNGADPHTHTHTFAEYAQNGNTPLHMGSAYGRTDVVQFLVDQGVEINATNKYGETALFYACYRGYADIAAFLIEQAGCDLEIRNKVQTTVSRNCRSRAGDF